MHPSASRAFPQAICSTRPSIPRPPSRGCMRAGRTPAPSARNRRSRATRRATLLHGHPAAQRHRLAAHRPCAEQHAAGRARPLPPHEGRRGPVAAGHRPRRHRHPDGGGAPARRRGQHLPPRHGPRRVRRAGLEVEGAVRRDHHRPAPPARRLVRLEPRALHPGRGPVGGGAQGVRRAVQQRADLSRQAAGELGPALPDRHQRPGGRDPRRTGQDVAFRLSAGGRAHRRRRRDRHRHHPAGDHARRRRGGRAPGRSALHEVRRADGAPAHRRPADPGHRRRLPGPGEGLGRGEDHRRPRLQRLRGRQAPRPVDDLDHGRARRA